MQDLEQFSYSQGKRLMSAHWYNLYNPVISVELTELYDREVGNNDAVEDWLSYNWLLAQLQSPGNEFELVITLIHEEHDVIDRKQ